MKGNFFYLFISFLCLLLIYPFFEGEGLETLAFLGILFIVLFSAVYAVEDGKRWHRLCALILAIGSFASNCWMLWGESFLGMLLAHFFLTAFFIFTIKVILSSIMHVKKVTGNILFGSINIYLLFGMLWAVLFSFISIIQPQAFVVNLPHERIGMLSWTQFIYYSFATLTTVGYGDIAPVTSHAQSLAILEAVTGVLYVAILIAKLIGLYLHESSKE